MKFMKLLNEIKEHTDDEIVDFKEIDLRHEFDKLNKLLFNNELHAPVLQWHTRKTNHGFVRFSRNRLTGEHTILSLNMSKFLKIPYKFFKDVLAHEMIHLYWLEQGDWKENHGFKFIQQMNRINSMGLGFNVTIRGGSEKFGVSDEVAKQGMELVVFFVKTDKSRGWQLSVTKPQTYKTEGKHISKLYQNLTNKNKFQNVVGEFYLSRNVDLQKYPVQRSFVRSISFNTVEDETYEKYKNDSQFLSSFIVNNQSPEPQWNGTDIPNEPVAKQPNKKRTDDFFGLGW